MQVVAEHAVNATYTVKLAIGNSGKHSVLVYKDGKLDGTYGTNGVFFYADEAQARAAANEAWSTVKRGEWMDRNQRQAQRDAAQAQREEERKAQHAHSLTDEGVQALWRSRSAQVLLSVPEFAREAIIRRMHFLTNVTGGLPSSNMSLAKDEWLSLGGDLPAARALEARTSDENARLMGWK